MRRTLGPRMAVDVDVKDLPGSQKKLTIKVSGDECTNAYESVWLQASYSGSIKALLRHYYGAIQALFRLY